MARDTLALVTEDTAPIEPTTLPVHDNDFILEGARRNDRSDTWNGQVEMRQFISNERNDGQPLVWFQRCLGSSLDLHCRPNIVTRIDGDARKPKEQTLPVGIILSYGEA